VKFIAYKTWSWDTQEEIELLSLDDLLNWCLKQEPHFPSGSIEVIIKPPKPGEDRPPELEIYNDYRE
jgi:hypothetical protein